jgi:hypothetical protein
MFTGFPDCETRPPLALLLFVVLTVMIACRSPSKSPKIHSKKVDSKTAVSSTTSATIPKVPNSSHSVLHAPKALNDKQLLSHNKLVRAEVIPAHEGLSDQLFLEINGQRKLLLDMKKKLGWNQRYNKKAF